jgi:hypothetical protein
MTYESTTTLSRIRDAKPCEDGWAKLLKHLGKTKADDEPLELLTVLESNGLDDALWVLSYAMPDDRLARHFQAWCVEQVLHIFEARYPDDTRVRDQIAMLRNDDATDEERFHVRTAVGAAAWDASEDAAWVAARDAAWDVSGAAARAAVWAAAEDAAWDAALAASRAAAWDAARDDQERQLRAMIGEPA